MNGKHRRAIAAPLIVVAVLSARPDAPHAQSVQPVNERGRADAPITIVEYCAYESDPCARLNIVLSVVIREYADRVRFVFRHVPSDETLAASLRYRAALAAGAQGQFWPMHDMLLANRGRTTLADILAMAGQLGLDAARFRADIDDPSVAAAAKSDGDQAVIDGVSAVPAVIVNGRATTNVKDASGIRAAIDRALSR